MEPYFSERRTPLEPLTERVEPTVFKPLDSFPSAVIPRPIGYEPPETRQFLEKLNHEADKRNNGLASRLVKLIPAAYWRPNRIERWRDGRIYEYIAIKTFKKYLPGSGDIASKESRKFPARPTGIESLIGDDMISKKEYLTRTNEMIHLVAGSLGIIAFLLPGSANFPIVSGVMVALNSVGNGYCVMLQRYTRARIYNLMDKRLELRAKRLGKF